MSATTRRGTSAERIAGTETRNSISPAGALQIVVRTVLVRERGARAREDVGPLREKAVNSGA